MQEDVSDLRARARTNETDHDSELFLEGRRWSLRRARDVRHFVGIRIFRCLEADMRYRYLSIICH
jgi:hypothetical protein